MIECRNCDGDGLALVYLDELGEPAEPAFAMSIALVFCRPCLGTGECWEVTPAAAHRRALTPSRLRVLRNLRTAQAAMREQYGCGCALCMRADLRNEGTPCLASRVHAAEYLRRLPAQVELDLRAGGVEQFSEAERQRLDPLELFRCDVCRQIVPWENGSADDMPGACDDCWFTHSARASECKAAAEAAGVAVHLGPALLDRRVA